MYYLSVAYIDTDVVHRAALAVDEEVAALLGAAHAAARHRQVGDEGVRVLQREDARLAAVGGVGDDAGEAARQCRRGNLRSSRPPHPPPSGSSPRRAGCRTGSPGWMPCS